MVLDSDVYDLIKGHGISDMHRDLLFEVVEQCSNSSVSEKTVINAIKYIKTCELLEMEVSNEILISHLCETKL